MNCGTKQKANEVRNSTENKGQEKSRANGLTGVHRVTLTLSCHISDVSALFLSHVTQYREDDETSQETRQAVGGARYQRVSETKEFTCNAITIDLSQGNR